jgi:hypothetical protein
VEQFDVGAATDEHRPLAEQPGPERIGSVVV